MAFFGITYLGTQNYLKDISVNSQKDSLRSTRELGYLALPPLPTKYRETCKAHIPRKMEFSYGLGHQNSLVEMKRLATKHIKCPEGMKKSDIKFYFFTNVPIIMFNFLSFFIERLSWILSCG